MPHDIRAAIENVGFAVRDMDPLRGFFLKRELSAGFYASPALCEHNVAGQQQLDAGHHTDVGVGVQKLPKVRRRKILVL